MNVDPSAMTVKNLRQELESLGIDTRSFLEKSEFIDALLTARKGGKHGGGEECCGRVRCSPHSQSA